MLMLALAMAAATPQPWVEMSAGPMLLRESGRSGVGSGPLVRLDVGYPMGERFAAEVWLSGAMESAPSGPVGDRALVGGGVGGRALLKRFSDDGKLALWGHAGAGWGLAA